MAAPDGDSTVGSCVPVQSLLEMQHRRLGDYFYSGNRIVGGSLPNIRMAGTDGSRIEGNGFESPKPGRSSARDGGAAEPVTMENCENSTVGGNVVR